jgi:hypothetical protein
MSTPLAPSTPQPGSAGSPVAASAAAPPFPGFEDGASNTSPADDEDELEFAVVEDDEHAVTRAQSPGAQPTASEDEDDLAFELSDDDFF